MKVDRAEFFPLEEFADSAYLVPDSEFSILMEISTNQIIRDKLWHHIPKSYRDNKLLS